MDSNKHSLDWQAVADLLEIERSLQPIHPERFRPKDEIDWTSMQFLLPPQIRQPVAHDISDARTRLKEFLAQKEQRLHSLSRFLADNGLRLGPSEDEVDAVNRFYVRNVHGDRNTGDIHFLWIGFVWDYGLYLGETAIMQALPFRKLRWRARDISAKRFVEPFRAIYEVAGYRNGSIGVRFDSLIFWLGRHMIARDVDDRMLEDGMDLTKLFSRDLAKSLRWASSSKQGSGQPN